ncbi:MAG: ABC transporter ATP-binding protein [Thermoleophilia bacterium]
MHTPPSPPLRTVGLTKDFGGGRGVFGLDLELRPGEVLGYLGPNGAGKTTTIRMLLDLLRPTAGRVELFGLDPRREGVAARRRVGYLPGELALYESMTGAALLDYFADLRGAGREESRRLAERLGLDLSRPIHELSRGNKQKAGLIQALMHRPDLLVLDEPTSGLDPLVQREFHRIVREAADEGRTVLLSSHTLSEVERIADRVAILREGRLLLVEDIGALKTRATRRIELRFAAPAPAAAFRDLPGVRAVEVEGDAVRLTVDGPIDPVVKAAAAFETLDVVSHEADLEAIFLGLYHDGPDAAQAA